ncbi:gamma-secretase subunit APH-1B isoform X3 [Fukomys damarensis]|nr:gamma-secretase subunit APH-1B isoform X3 [Fukomys damarensis]
MTAAVFFGCAFIAFGPALALYVFTIATEPLRIIFLIAGAFFWLVSLLISSLFWFLARLITDNKDGPMQKYLLIFGVLLSIFIQEMFRFAYYRLLKKASEGLKSINPDETAPSMRLLAYVSGLGFGIMSGVFSFVNTLSNSLGPGTVGIHGDSPQFFLNSAFMTLVVILLHVFWGIVFFDACEKKKWYVLLIVLLTHLLVSAQVPADGAPRRSGLAKAQTSSADITLPDSKPLLCQVSRKEGTRCTFSPESACPYSSR